MRVIAWLTQGWSKFGGHVRKGRSTKNVRTLGFNMGNDYDAFG